MNKRNFLQTLAALMAAPASTVFAQGKPIRMIVPLPAGTSNDFAARAITTPLAQVLGQSIVIDNKSGGNGIIAVADILRAPPDGLTLMCGSLSPLATNVAFVKGLNYDPRKDFTPIAGTSLTNHVLVVKANSPIRTFAEFIAHAKQSGKVTVGSSTSIAMLQISTMSKLAGIQLQAIPYKGTPASITDVIGGVLDATLTDQGNAMAQVKGGNLRALAVSSLKRNPAMPDWPAISETLPGFDFPSWNAFVGPAGMQRDVVNRLSAAIAQVQKQPDTLERMAASGTIPLVMGPDELKTYIDSEINKYVRLAREANIQPE